MIGSNKIISLEEKIKNNLSFEKRLYIKCFITILVTNLFVFILASSESSTTVPTKAHAVPKGYIQLNIKLKSSFLNRADLIQEISIFDSNKKLIIEKALFIKNIIKKDFDENKNEATVEINQLELEKVLNSKDSNFIITPYTAIEKKEINKITRNKYEITF